MASPELKIALLEPFFTGSHRRWAEDLQKRSSHSIDLVTLPGRHWKWRMHGAAVSFAEKLLSQDTQYDLFLASDMLDLATFLGLVRGRYPYTPSAVYFHENQITYPWSPNDPDPRLKQDRHYGFINYTTALAADAVYFNSHYHREAFLSELDHFLGVYPDHRNRSTLTTIRKKASTLHLALDLASLDAHRPKTPTQAKRPLILWNHRWEYDKNPDSFLRLLESLQQQGLDFEVALLGEAFSQQPEKFQRSKDHLGNKVVAFGHCDSASEYAKWLWQADILPVTSVQDFFGGSVVEAIYCDCHAVLPQRLAYTDHLHPTEYPNCYYETDDALLQKVSSLIRTEDWREKPSYSHSMKRYDWAEQIKRYDTAFTELTASVTPPRKRW